MNNNNDMNKQLKATSGNDPHGVSDEEQPEALPAANSEHSDDDAAAAQEADQSHASNSTLQRETRADRVTALVTVLSSQQPTNSDTSSNENLSHLDSETRELESLAPRIEGRVGKSTEENTDSHAQMNGRDNHLQTLNDQTGKLDSMLDSLTQTHTWVAELDSALVEDFNACNELAINMQAHEQQLVELEALVDQVCGGNESSNNAVEAEPIDRDDLNTLTDVHAVNRLLIALNGDQVIKYPLYKKIVTIGRGAFNDIQIRTQFVSRSHARILTDSSGAIIEDMNSKNGVTVNGQNAHLRRLKNGDVVDVGKIHFKFIDLMDDDAGEGTA
jgi:hypothetical protein